jgi:ABC-type transporter Mla maintaining outer membrane lipid asymmetry ATPase subunit MlaF/ABC-type transporter Mla maintaining outer membrane lipid asymmetry permease subunit MlaE
LPDGRELIRELSLEVGAGEVAVVLGGSGSGKSTLSRVLFERDALIADGFELSFVEVSAERDKLGLVPQRGALFDHLDVGGNLELAHRYRSGGGDGAVDVGDWLSRVGLDPELAGADPSALSGGQAQRVAVARTLVAGREILFLDEPSVGLDPARVRQLARLIREQVARLGVAAIVVTHDVALAGGVADTLHVLDPEVGALRPLFDRDWPGPLEAEGVDDDERGRWLLALEGALIDAIEAPGSGRPRLRPGRGPASRWLRRAAATAARPFAAAGFALRHAPAQLARRPRDFARIAWRVALQSLIRPLPFYAIVSVLIGYTVLFVISKIGGAGVRPDALIRQIGGSYVLALAPPLSAVLFVAASGAAVNAWLGSVTLTRQVLALEALGVDPRAYLWAPAWLAAALAYLIVAALFGAGMIAGGWILADQLGMDDAFALLTADLLDPRPDRSASLWRGLFLVWIYAWGIASDAIARGTAAKRSADDVTRAMTGSVVACTLWVVAWELVTVLWVF